MQLGGEQLRLGPVNNIQLLYILLDRALLFYAHVINWAHGRRDYDSAGRQGTAWHSGKEGYTANWSREERRVGERFFTALRQGKELEVEESTVALHQLLRAQFEGIAEARQ